MLIWKQYLKYGDMCMIYLRMEFHEPDFNKSLVISIKPKAKYVSTIPS
jgi:hypothetical protein